MAWERDYFLRQVSAVTDEHRKYKVHKSCGRGLASKSPALSQRTREGQGTHFLCEVKA